MASRTIDDVIDFIGMDASLSYDGRNTNVAHTMRLSGGSLGALGNDEALILTSNLSYFLATDVGKEIHLTAGDGTIVRCVIESYTSATQVIARPNRVVPVDIRYPTEVSEWSKAIKTIGNLHHLEGQQISIFADRFVVANPNNSAYVTRTVTNGSVTLDKGFAVIHVGLPITHDLETLDIDTAQGETVMDKKKFASRLAIMVEGSRGIWAGTRPPTSDASLDGLFELKIRNEESYDDAVTLATGVVDMNIEPSWNAHGRIFIRQTDPVPLTVLAVAPSGLIPVRTGG
jgi:hypothetical protein